MNISRLWPGFCGAVMALYLTTPCNLSAQTIAFWPFDEPRGLYPSCVLDDVSRNNYPLVLGPGGQIVEGKFGNALDPSAQAPVRYPDAGSVLFGLSPAPKPPGRTVEPMNWKNAMFCALMTSGEKHLRKEVRFPNASQTKLNLGDFDWTVEFWYMPARRSANFGTVFEIGTGPRGENDQVSRLSLAADGRAFELYNQASGTRTVIPTDPVAMSSLGGGWHHVAFVYSQKQKLLRHFVDGKAQPASPPAALKALPVGEESYFTVGRTGTWQNPLAGRIDELRFSEGILYSAAFTPPSSLSLLTRSVQAKSLVKGPPPLFDASSEVLPLMSRKHVFIDGSIAQRIANITFVVNPPRRAERVVDNIRGAFRKHLNVLEDESGLIRMYFGVQNDYLAVLTSRDGMHWEKPMIRPDADPAMRNVVLAESTGMGQVFIDPNAPPEERWKFISGYEGRGIYLFSSPDGWSFKRYPAAVLPFRSGSQSNIFYDDQRQLYVSYHRSDYGTTHDGKTQREFVLAETRDLEKPWPVSFVTQQDVEKASQTRRLHKLNPWYLDNGPLTPGGFGIELPSVFQPDDALDPQGTDIYVPKVVKYPWAPDTYLAFPLIYFHYEDEGPPARRVLGTEVRGMGSGPLETQVAVSRDGLRWTRYPRPVYVGTGEHNGDEINQVYMAQGLIRRQNEIWQYFFGEEAFHSSFKRDLKRAVYRVVQRLDGFVSADSPYDSIGEIVTRPLVFEGSRLVLNIDTGSAGYAQVGLLDGTGRPIEGYSVDDCIYINGNAVEKEVEWLKKGKDVLALQGKPVRVIIRTRGTKLYSMKFANR